MDQLHELGKVTVRSTLDAIQDFFAPIIDITRRVFSLSRDPSMLKSRPSRGEMTETETTKLGSWLTKKRGLMRFVNKQLLLVLSFALFTAFVIILGSYAHVPANLPWFSGVLLCLSNVALGASVVVWWERSFADSKNRREAMRINEKIEEEIQIISKNWQQTIVALHTLVSNPTPGFIQATEYFLGNQQLFVESTLMSYALQIDRLGYDSEKFLDEKRARFTQIKMKTRETLRTIPSDKVFVSEIFNKIDPEIFDFTSLPSSESKVS